MTAVSISHARENLFPLVRQVSEDHVVIEIVARNGGNAVLMSAEDYESLQETLYLFSTRANAAHILRGLAEAAEYLQIPAGLVEAAVAYYGEYRDEIDREIELNEAEYERGRAAAAAGEQALRS